MLSPQHNMASTLVFLSLVLATLVSMAIAINDAEKENLFAVDDDADRGLMELLMVNSKREWEDDDTADSLEKKKRVRPRKYGRYYSK